MGRRGSSSRGSSGRGSSGGGFFGRSSPAPQTKTAPAAAPAPPPQRAPQPKAPTQTATMSSPPPSGGGGMLSGLGSVIAQGMAFGTGSAVAHRTVDAVMGPRSVQHEYAESKTETTSAAPVAARSCDNFMADFNKCLTESKGNAAACQFQFDMVTQCQRGV